MRSSSRRRVIRSLPFTGIGMEMVFAFELQVVQPDGVVAAKRLEFARTEYLAPAGHAAPVFAEIASYVAQVLDAVHLYRAGADGVVVFVVERQEEVFAGDVVVRDVGHPSVVDVGVAARSRHVEGFGVRFHTP